MTDIGETLHVLGIAYGIFSAFLNSLCDLTTKNVHNQNGQHIRPQENLLPRAFTYLLATALFMWIKKITIFGLEKKTNLILQLVGILCTLYVHCVNVALYAISVGDIHVLSYLSIISTIIFERLFRKKEIRLWTGVFSMGIIVGGALVAQPEFIMEAFGYSSDVQVGGTMIHSSVLSNRIIGIVAIFFAFNMLAIITILMNMANETSPVLFIFYQGVWQLLLFPVALLAMPIFGEFGRLFTPEIKDFLQYDFFYHCIAGLMMLGCWLTEILALRNGCSTVVLTVLRGFSLVFDYGGQAIIDWTLPNSMAWAGIVVIQVSVILVTMEIPILNCIKQETDSECEHIIPKQDQDSEAPLTDASQ